MAGTKQIIQLPPPQSDSEPESEAVDARVTPGLARLDSREEYINFFAGVAQSMLLPLQVWKSELENMGNSEDPKVRETAMERARNGMGVNALVHAKEARAWFGMAMDLEAFPSQYERKDAEKLKPQDIQELSAEELRELIGAENLQSGLAQARASIKQRKRERSANHQAHKKNGQH